MKNKLLAVSLFFLSSCNFSSNIQRDVLNIQKLIQDKEYNTASLEYEKILEKKLPENLKMNLLIQSGDLERLYLANYKKSEMRYLDILRNTKNPVWVIKTKTRLANLSFELTRNYKLAYENYVFLSNFEPKLDSYDFFSYRVGLSLLKLNKFKKSLEAFKKISNQNNHGYNIESLKHIASNYFFLNKYKEALKYYREYLSKEKNKDKLVEVKFLIANTYERTEELDKAYNIYYSILNQYPHPNIIQEKLKSIYERRVAKKR